MTLYYCYYGLNEDYSKNWRDPHIDSVSGENATECMKKYVAGDKTHDVSKYTRREIISVHDW